MPRLGSAAGLGARGSLTLDEAYITSQMQGKRATQAAHYAALGLALIPLEPRSKGPRTSGWQDRPITTPEAARTFWTKHPEHNLGVLHGSSFTAALDIDHLDGARLALAEIGADLDQLLEARVRIQGAKGVKPLYNALGLSFSRKVLTWPHPDKAGHKLTVLELRGGPGCQDVLPPSIHPSGTHYTWDGVTPSSRGDLDDLPEVLLHLWENWDTLRPAMEAACPWAGISLLRSTLPSSQPRSGVSSSPARDGLSVIAAFNMRFSAAEVLERNGYTLKGERWSAPTSQSGMAGVVLLEGRVYSHHASDPLGDGHTHDAFGVFTRLEHGGDVRGAVRAAAGVLGFSVSPTPGSHPGSSGAGASPAPRPWSGTQGWGKGGSWGSVSSWNSPKRGGWRR